MPYYCFICHLHKCFLLWYFFPPLMSRRQVIHSLFCQLISDDLMALLVMSVGNIKQKKNVSRIHTLHEPDHSLGNKPNKRGTCILAVAFIMDPASRCVNNQKRYNIHRKRLQVITLFEHTSAGRPGSEVRCEPRDSLKRLGAVWV